MTRLKIKKKIDWQQQQQTSKQTKPTFNNNAPRKQTILFKFSMTQEKENSPKKKKWLKIIF